MPIEVNLRHLEEKDLVLQGRLPAAELDLDGVDEMIRALHPLEYNLRVELFEGSLLAQGRLELRLACECVRCLKAFVHVLELADWTCHLPLRGEDSIEARYDCVDLTPQVREDILLAFPQYPVCDIECCGLRPAAPNSPLQAGSVLRAETEGSVWAELNKLKL
jgi:uncharacterized protein